MEAGTCYERCCKLVPWYIENIVVCDAWKGASLAATPRSSNLTQACFLFFPNLRVFLNWSTDSLRRHAGAEHKNYWGSIWLYYQWPESSPQPAIVRLDKNEWVWTGQLLNRILNRTFLNRTECKSRTRAAVSYYAGLHTRSSDRHRAINVLCWAAQLSGDECATYIIVWRTLGCPVCTATKSQI